MSGVNRYPLGQRRHITCARCSSPLALLWLLWSPCVPARRRVLSAALQWPGSALPSSPVSSAFQVRPGSATIGGNREPLGQRQTKKWHLRTRRPTWIPTTCERDAVSYDMRRPLWSQALSSLGCQHHWRPDVHRSARLLSPSIAQSPQCSGLYLSLSIHSFRSPRLTKGRGSPKWMASVPQASPGFRST